MASLSLKDFESLVKGSGTNEGEVANSKLVTSRTTNPSGDQNARDNNENKGKVSFVNAVADKIIPVVLAIVFFGLFNSHGPNAILSISDKEIHILATGGIISAVNALLYGFTSYFKDKDIESTDGLGFFVVSMAVLFHLMFPIVASCIVMCGFKGASKLVVWSIGVSICTLVLLVWVAFLHFRMIHTVIYSMKFKFDKMRWALKTHLNFTKPIDKIKNKIQKVIYWMNAKYVAVINLFKRRSDGSGDQC